MQGGPSINGNGGAAAPTQPGALGARAINGLQGNVYAAPLGKGTSIWNARAKPAPAEAAAPAAPKPPTAETPLLVAEDDDADTGPSKCQRWGRYVLIAAGVATAITIPSVVCGLGYCKSHSSSSGSPSQALAAIGGGLVESASNFITGPAITLSGGDADAATWVAGNVSFSAPTTDGAPNATYAIGPLNIALDSATPVVPFNVSFGSVAEAQAASNAENAYGFPAGGAGSMTVLSQYGQANGETTDVINSTVVKLVPGPSPTPKPTPTPTPTPTPPAPSPSPVPPAPFAVVGQATSSDSTNGQAEAFLSAVGVVNGNDTAGYSLSINGSFTGGEGDPTQQNCTVNAGGQSMAFSPAAPQGTLVVTGIQTEAALNGTLALADSVCYGNGTLTTKTQASNGQALSAVLPATQTNYAPPAPPAPVGSMLFTGSVGEITCYSGLPPCILVQSANLTGANPAAPVIWYISAQMQSASNTSSLSVANAGGSSLVTVSPQAPSAMGQAQDPTVAQALSDINAWAATAEQSTGGQTYVVVGMQAYQPAAGGQSALLSNIAYTNITYYQGNPPCDASAVPTQGQAGNNIPVPLLGQSSVSFDGAVSGSLQYVPSYFDITQQAAKLDCSAPGMCTFSGMSADELNNKVFPTLEGFGTAYIPVGPAGCAKITLVINAGGGCQQRNLVVGEWCRATMPFAEGKANLRGAGTQAAEPVATVSI